MLAGLSNTADQDQQFRPPCSLLLCQKHSIGAFSSKWSKSEHSSPGVTTHSAGPPGGASSLLICLPCQNIAIIWKGTQCFERIRG